MHICTPTCISMAPYCMLEVIVCRKIEAIPVPKFFMSFISTRHLSLTEVYFMPDLGIWLTTTKDLQGLGLLKLAVLGIFDLAHATRPSPSHFCP